MSGKFGQYCEDAVSVGATEQVIQGAKQRIYTEAAARAVVDRVNELLKNTKDGFEDATFPPHVDTIYGKPDQNFDKELSHSGPCLWLRPAALTKEKPKLYDEGVEVEDVVQGHVGNCWLMAVFASIATRPEIVQRIFYPSTYNRQGIYAVRFYYGGAIRCFIIDDFLPCKGSTPLFAHSSKKGEIWVALLEKAYAKFCGCYQALVGQNQMLNGPKEVFKMFADGEISQLGTGSTPDKWFKKLAHHFTNKWLGSCGTGEGGKGIVPNHAYTVLDAVDREVKQEDGSTHRLQLIKLRNTWGGTEWTGDWSDKSELWDQHPEMKDLRPVTANDGIFWISAVDYQQYFGNVNLCKISFDSYLKIPRLSIPAGYYRFKFSEDEYPIEDRPQFFITSRNNTEIFTSVSCANYPPGKFPATRFDIYELYGDLQKGEQRLTSAMIEDKRAKLSSSSFTARSSVNSSFKTPCLQKFCMLVVLPLWKYQPGPDVEKDDGMACSVCIDIRAPSVPSPEIRHIPHPRGDELLEKENQRLASVRKAKATEKSVAGPKK